MIYLYIYNKDTLYLQELYFMKKMSHKWNLEKRTEKEIEQQEAQEVITILLI